VRGFLEHVLALISLLLAQSFDVRAQDFYPLEHRNTWNYRVFYLPTADSGSVEIAVLSDTTMPNGRVYHRLDKGDVLGGLLVRADTDYVYYCSPNTGTEVAMYNLRGSVGTVDTLRWGGLFTSRVTAVGTRAVFGLQRTVRMYAFDGLVQYQVSLADGFGIIEAHDYGDGGFPLTDKWWVLRGSIIRDTLHGTVLSIPAEGVRIAKFWLEQNYPNPFNPSTTIGYALPQGSYVTLTVFNTLGQQVATLINETRGAGYHNVQFNGTGFASGVYFYRLRAGDYVVTKRLILLR
jgi:hypothetical protein